MNGGTKVTRAIQSVQITRFFHRVVIMRISRSLCGVGCIYLNLQFTANLRHRLYITSLCIKRGDPFENIGQNSCENYVANEYKVTRLQGGVIDRHGSQKTVMDI